MSAQQMRKAKRGACRQAANQRCLQATADYSASSHTAFYRPKDEQCQQCDADRLQQGSVG